MEFSSKHIVSNTVTLDVARTVIEAYKEGTLKEYTFDIKDHTIDMSTITPFVKVNMGRKFNAAHIFAMRELRRILEKQRNETEQ